MQKNLSGFFERRSYADSEFKHGFAHDVPEKENFNAVLSILVGHFIKRSERLAFYKTLVDQLKSSGYLVNVEISFDLDSDKFPLMLNAWESVQKKMGGTKESLSALPKQMRDVLTLLPPEKVEELIRQSGLDTPVQFFRAFMITGWYGVKK